MLSSKLNLLSIAATLSLMSTAGTVEAFQFQPQSCSNAPVSTRLHAHEPIDNRISHNAFTRRKALQKSAGVTLSILLGGTAMTNSANAKYSTYTRREEDWSERQKNGEIKYSNSRELRAQLQEIAPMNSEGSKLFCPNGPSANVSPLMENKCGDRQALPSVYGRNNDVMGNSIPGFGSVGAANAATVSELRNELNAQAYFRD